MVEDNSINQLVAEGVLRRLGYEVVLADNGAAGVAAVADDPEAFVAILMDCQMPVMDGFDATRAVRAIQSVSTRNPVIAMTAAAVAEERDRCLDAGMDDFLTKPVDVGLLSAMLERWIAPSSQVIAPVVEVDSPVTARLRELLEEGIDAAYVLRIATTFPPKAVSALAALQAAVDADSAEEVVRHAHSLLGSVGNVGLTAVAHLARQIELGARADVLPDGALMDDLRAAVDRGSAELDAFVRDQLSTT
ncbi:MAG: response regulator [Nocardioides sp.]|nr:response regulator [Nocardioides sp.]